VEWYQDSNSIIAHPPGFDITGLQTVAEIKRNWKINIFHPMLKLKLLSAIGSKANQKLSSGRKN